MAKEILIYGDINSYSSEEFINSVNEFECEDLTVRINSNGGGPEYGFGMAAKFREFEGSKLIKVDGKAHSTAMFFLLYADDVEALDVSEFLIHRAAYPEWLEGSEFFTDELRGNLERINNSLKKALEAKIDIAKLEELKGVSMKDIFSMESRIDVFLTASEAKKVGLINRINKLTPAKKTQIDARMFELAAKYTGEVQQNDKLVQTTKIEKMTIEKLKAEHPDLCAQIHAQGVSEEKDRVGAWLVFNEIDAKSVSEGVKSGQAISQTAMAEFSMKKLSAQSLVKIEAESAGNATTTVVEGAEKEPTELEALEAKMNVELGIK